MSAQGSLLVSIANTIADYRQHDGFVLAPNHVGRWIAQFNFEVQLPILEELDHVLKRTYLSRAVVDQFLANVVATPKLTGPNSREFWKSANFLSIQAGGNSQRDMLARFDEVLRRTNAIALGDCGSEGGPYIYLDDVVFSGNRVKNDLVRWISAECPDTASLHVIVLAYHRGGQWYAQNALDNALRQSGKKVTITWWHLRQIENRKAHIHKSDVLCPSVLPEEESIQAYVRGLSYPPLIRHGSSIGENKFFSSDEKRCLLELELLKAGLRIRALCPQLNTYMRPLGNMVLASLGFGSLIVTFRNCPNNVPLALWAGTPWYPLFPRKTN